jgi:hypothetical protein
MVEKNYKTHSVNTAIQEVVFTLDNAKFWYVKINYKRIIKLVGMQP